MITIQDADHFPHPDMKFQPSLPNHKSIKLDHLSGSGMNGCNSPGIMPKCRPSPAVLNTLNWQSHQCGICSAGTISTKLSRLMIVMMLLAFFIGCSSSNAGLSGDKQKPPDAAAGAAAQAVLSTLSSRNAGLNNFKGKGKIKVWQKGKLKFKEKIYWVGSESDKISIVLLIGGYPAVKMASDGKWFYYYEVGEGKPIYRKIAASDASLKRIISISIQTDDVLSLIAGRVPIREHHRAILEPQEAKPGYVLVLKRRWWGVTEKIYLDSTKTQAQQVEFFNRSGSLIYRARFEEMQTINEYLVPARLSITNGLDADFELDVNGFWTDVAVTPSMFVLKPPK